MLGGIAFSVYEWLKCALAWHSFLIVEGSIDKMKNIYPLNSRFTLPFAFVLAVSLLAVSLMFMLPGGLLHAQADEEIQYPENGTGPVATFTAIDPEGASVVWSLATGGDMEDFSIENGVLRFKSSPDFENPGDTGTDNTYDVTVRASDGGDVTTATEDVTVRVTNVEEPGTITLSTLQPQVDVAIMATLTDPDNIGNGNVGSITWQWYRGNTPIAGGTNGAGAVTSMYTPAAGDVGSVLSAKAMYDDDEGDDKTAEEDSANAVREAPASNVSPTFPMIIGGSGTDQTREIAENTPAGTNIGAPVAASDTDVLTYSLDGTDAASFDINRATGHLITKGALDHENDEEYEVMVEAKDPFGAMVSATVTIEVTDVNEDPSVTGAASIDHAESNANTVIALATNVYTATDADEDDDAADAAEVKWSLSGADASKFDITGTGNTRTLAFKANPDYESPGDSGSNNVYEVTVVVTDTKSNTDEQAVMVKVTNIEEDGAITFSTLQSRVGFPVTATLTDPDNITAGSVSWQWYRGDSLTTNNLSETECVNANSDDCPIKDATSGTYRPDAGDVSKRLAAVATYTDGNANEGDAKDVTLGETANNVLAATLNQAPVFPDQDAEMDGNQTAQERLVGENVPVAFGSTAATEPVRNVGAVVAATTDDDGALTYSLGGPDAASFGIMPDTGQLQTKADVALDYETKATYTVTVTATDSFGASSTITVTIKVDDVDEIPELVGEAPEEYAENGTGAVATFVATDPEDKSITWTLGGADAAVFSIVNGVLRFESSPNYEDTGNPDHMYTATIQASDGGGDTTATKEVTIAITNVDEPGTVTLDTLQPQVDEEITATLDDPDNEEANTVTWQWYRGNSPISGATDGVNTLTSMYTPSAGDVGSVLRATAMYDDGEGDDKTARQDSYRNVRSAPAANTAPTFPDQDPGTNENQTAQTREVAENTPEGTNLGAPIAANDPGDVLTYSLDAAGAESFDIVRSSGQLQTKTDLDFETGSTYTVTVTATDPFGSPATSQVTITVTDVNEAPMLTGGATSIDLVENSTDLDDDTTDNVTEDEFTVADEDTVDVPGDLKWTLSGADASKFDISTTGGATRTLSLKDAPDYEAPGDSGSDNVYEVTVVVTDTKGNSDSQDVTVKVTNVEEAGTVTLSTLQPRVAFPVTATLADPDNITAGSVSWQWFNGTVNINTAQENNGLPEECATTAANNCAIKGAISDTYTPVTADVGDTLTAVAIYTDGSPNEDDAEDVVGAPAANQVLADTRNKAPMFPDQDAEMDGDQTDQERSVLENVPAIGSALATEPVRPVGDPVTAMDFITVNVGTQTPEILTYSLGGPDADSFTIDRGTAQINTKADVSLDTETKDTYIVTVTATDPSGLSATITVTITVTGVDEAPIIMIGGLAISGLRNVRYAENGTGMVATYVANGPNAASARWSSLEGPDAGDFTFSGGVLTFRSSPDYEMPADADTNNIYMVTLKADDGTYMATYDVTVRVTDEDDTTTPGGSLLEQYDSDNSGHIDLGEAVEAVLDYHNGTLSLSDTVDVILLYHAGP